MSQLKIPKSLDFSPRTAPGKSSGQAASDRKSSPSDSELARVVEPLVTYICASDRPRAALLSAMVVLRSEMEATNRAARAHYGPLLECH